jgi:hypothetical protein
MGPTYQSGLDLDRRDNNQGYNPENCRWVERKTNSRNKRNNRVIDTPFGNMTVSALSEMTGIGVTTLIYRLDHNWPIESLCIPPDARNRCMTSKTAVPDTDLLSGIVKQKKPA